MAGNKGEKAAGDDMFGPEPWTRWYKSHTRLIVICVVVAVVLIAFWYFMPHGHGDDSTNKTAQKTLETSLAVALNDNDNQQILNITGQLIGGASSGIYHIDNESLAKYHMDRVTSFLNLNNNAAVAKDADAAARLSPTYKKVALQFEFQAQYTLGERQQLIPILNEIVQIEKTSQNPMRGSEIDQYQEYISDIQHNKEINF